MWAGFNVCVGVVMGGVSLCAIIRTGCQGTEE